MGLNCGIVGLPNVGKSTIFSALTAAPAESANYPFCTIDPNVGIVNIPDARMDKIGAIVGPQKMIPAVVEFVDIAGLVKGASQGEGLGNKFLSHIRQVGVIIQVVRCFENEDIVHVAGKVDPLSDIETINVELALADLETVDKRIQRSEKNLRAGKDAAAEAKAVLPILQDLRALLSEGKPARSLELDDEQKKLIQDLHLITLKKTLFVCNVDEDSVVNGNAYVDQVRGYAEKEGAGVVVLSGQIEKEIAAMEDPEDQREFLNDLGLEESGLIQLIHEGYKLLGLRTFFTAGEKEVRAWTFHEGDKAPQAAGVIHTDFERGFIKAETYHCDDLFEHGTVAAVKAAGKLRQEGKEYLVKDGDVMLFKFNV